MKKILILFAIILYSSQIFSQEINYEQKAFDFLRDSIIKHKNKKIYVKTDIVEWNHFNSACLKKFNLISTDTINARKTSSKKINLYGNKKIKEVIGIDINYWNKTILVNRTYRFKDNQYISGITQKRGRAFTKYLIEMDENGKIKDWCEYISE